MCREAFKSLIDRLSAAYEMGESPAHLKKILDKHYKAIVQLGGNDGNGKGTLLYLFMEGCGHCQNFNAEWDKLTARLKDQVNFIKLDVNDQAASDLVTQLNVRGVPAIFFTSPQTGKMVPYKGMRTSEELTKFVTTFAPKN